jgi:poly(glycerol-phosphate) alpha-glucosyltransferase
LGGLAADAAPGAAVSAASLDGLRVTLLTASASRLGGGVATALYSHAALLREAGAEVTVVSLADEHSEDDRAALGPVPLRTVSISGPAFFGYAPDLLGQLLATEADLLHLHGIWMYPSHAAARWARSTGKPYVISPHGMLDPWITGRGRWKKMLARLGYERDSWRRAHAFHALTEADAADVRREAGDCEVAVIPTAGPPAIAAAAGERAPQVVFISRVHLKKNLAALLDGWETARLPAGARLTIAGWGDAADVAAFEARMARAPASAVFVGPVHGEAKRRLLEQARFVVLPSHSEGLPMTILEAWAAGTPTIMTAECHLPEGFAAGAALECGTGAASVAAALEGALTLDETAWRGMSDAALGLARGRFSATRVAREWAAACRALVERPER